MPFAGYASVEEICDQPWYYSVELTPGVFTPGRDHANVIATRELLSRLQFEDPQVLDIGVMEGAIPALLTRRGARVTALDAFDVSRKVQVVKQAHGVEFEYFPRTTLSDTLPFLRRRHKLQETLGHSPVRRGFDLVVCSGVLYHVFSFFEGLAICRGALRTGGYLVLETATSLRDDYALLWNYNQAGWIYGGGSNTWFVTARLLDHFLRLLRFRVVDAAYVGEPRPDGLVRLAVVAQAIDGLLCDEREAEYFEPTTRNFDYNQYCDLEFGVGPAQRIVHTPAGALPEHVGLGSVDLRAAVFATPGQAVDAERAKLRLTDLV